MLISLSVFPSEYLISHINFPTSNHLSLSFILAVFESFCQCFHIHFQPQPHLDYSSIHWYLFSLLLLPSRSVYSMYCDCVSNVRGKRDATLLNKNRQKCWDCGNYCLASLWWLLQNIFLYKNQGPVNNLPKYFYSTPTQGAACVQMDAGNSLSCASNTTAVEEMTPS
jgi:hypothetical protein